MEEEDIISIEPSKLTVNKLKSILSEEGVELSTKAEKKEYYVKKFEELQEKKRKEKKRPSSSEDSKDTKRSKKDLKSSQGTHLY